MIPGLDSIATWLAEWPSALLLLKATALLWLGGWLTSLLRRACAATRHLVWLTVFAGLALLPILRWTKITWGPSISVSSPVSMPATPPASASTNVKIAASYKATTETRVATTQPPPALPFDQLLGWCWLGGGLALLLRMLRDLAIARRMQRLGQPSLTAQHLTDQLARRCGIRREVTTVVHADLTTPCTIGWRRPTILLPTAAVSWPADALRRALTHELEHVRRHDWATQWFARCIRTAYWFHPSIWSAVRRLELEAERAADDGVARSHDPLAYADQLIALARATSTPATVAIGMAQPSELAGRVRALLDPTTARGVITPTARARVALSGLVAVCAIAPIQLTTHSVPAKSFPSSAPAEPLQVEPEPRHGRAGTPARPLTVRDGRLLQSAREGRTETVRSLLAAGASPNAVCSGEGSPLILAARGGHRPVVALLLEHGADPNLAVRGDGNPLIAAASAGQTSIAATLLAHGARVDSIVPGDETALITASAKGHLAVVRILVAAGAHPARRVRASSVRGPAGFEWRTALGMAKRNRHSTVVAFFRELGVRE